MKELKLVEGRNTGIPTILRAMKENGSDIPVFETDADRTYFTVVLPVHKKFLQTEIQQPAQPKTKTRRNVAEIKELILATLAQSGNLSSKELVIAMGYAKKTTAISKAIKELMEEEKIVYLIPEKIHDRNQKICLLESANVYE